MQAFAELRCVFSILVFLLYQGVNFGILFLCRAVCAELSDQKVSLKEIKKARSERRKQVCTGLSTRAVLVDRYVEIHNSPPPAPKTIVEEPAPVEARPRLKRYIND